MEKNKKGFTLIELLAVIVILAVIALIATPLIMNTISDAKEGSAKNSASGYVKALEQTISKAMVKDNTFKPDNRQIGVGKVTGVSQKEIVSGNLTKIDVTYDIDYKGTKPTGIDFILKNGDVVKDSKITISGYTFVMDEKGEWVLKGTPIELPKSFETDSWDTIARAVISENYPYKVGDTKEVKIEDLGTFTVRVANTTTPSECSQSGYSESACGFVVEFEDIVTTKQMNPTNTNAGGYPASDMKKYLSGEFFGMLPTELQKNIKTTTVVSSHGSKDTNNFTSTEKVYLLSKKEIWGKEEVVNKVDDDSAEKATHQLDYYKVNKVTTNNYNGAIKKNATGGTFYWWLRTANIRNTTTFSFVFSDGKHASTNASDLLGVSPAFRIG